ncbi:MAG: hypothetical protein J6V00_04635, partial [Bacteroidaceae bacterium]|nr:hypothetical protein [Bacteroidaceae bacterium]
FNAHYGHWDRKRPDPFDLKQAFFLRDWSGTGINLPKGLCANSSPKDKLVAKESVLDEKQQLELIPYASRKFDSFVSTQEVFPYIDLLLEEIFSADRKYVIFCANIFEEVFKAYNGYNQTNGKVAFVDVSKRGKPIRRKVEISYTNKKGEYKQTSCYCTVIELAYGGKSTRAIIANTFPKQNLTNAYEVMAAYGKFCYECLQGKNQNSVCRIELP